jgi:hypothetical protein
MLFSIGENGGNGSGVGSGSALDFGLLEGGGSQSKIKNPQSKILGGELRMFIRRFMGVSVKLLGVKWGLDREIL